MDNSNNTLEETKHVGFEGQPWEVHKFGGTSVANASCYRTVVGIVEDLLAFEDETTNNSTSIAVVVSAMGGKPKTTDLLLQTVSASAERNQDKVNEAIDYILKKHNTCLGELFQEDTETRERLQQMILKDINDIRDILKTVALMKWQATRISELVSGYGEVWSAQILSELLKQRCQKSYPSHHFVYLDARRVITIDEEAVKDGAVCWDICQEKLKQVYEEELSKLVKEGVVPADDNDDEEFKMHFCITGYVASNTHGVPTTLQRDGSDYSAAIMGKLLQSQKITIWTDVDGVLSADPRRVPNAHVLPEVSYNEAMELAYFGAKVIHPKTMEPAISCTPHQIPIYIRNTFHPAFRGTRIFTSSTTHTDRDKCVCGFSSVEHMALINVEGSGLIGVPGVAKRMFGTLESVGVNVVLISQASSEHSITFATVENQASIAKEAIEEEFHKELKTNRISQVDVQSPCSIIAAVGDGMSDTAGVSGRFFSALGDAQINVLAISQGCSERNISAVVLTSESTRALRAVHGAFRLSHTTVRVGVVGMNEVGDSLLKLLQSQRSKLRDAYEVDFQVCGVVADGTSDNVVCLKNDTPGSMDSITPSAFNAISAGGNNLLLGAPASSVVAFDEEQKVAVAKPGGVDALMWELISEDVAHHVIFDCTAEEKLGQKHADWLNAGVHVVTANNTGLSGSKELRKAISDAEVKNGKLLSAQYLREVTIAGGLPVLSTLRSLLNSGDHIRRIDGILTVAMSFIFFRISPPSSACIISDWDEATTHGAFRGDLAMSPTSKASKAVPLSEAVKEAMALGLMEDDPWKDLSNEYTARVLMVLGKELGLDDSTSTQQLVESSQTLLDDKVVDFTKPIPKEIDDYVAAKVMAAKSHGCVLRQVFSVDLHTKQMQIHVTEVPESHIFAVTSPSCECVRFFTQRHRRYPLVVQGPAAGADSTASALLAELLSLMRSKVGPRSGGLSRAFSSSAFLQQQAK